MSFFESMQNTIFAHFIDSDPETRAIVARAAQEQGIELACYHDWKAYVTTSKRDGLVLVHEARDESLVTALLLHCATLGHWPAVIGISADPVVEQIVAAMKAGALSFHILPRSGAALQEILDQAAADCGPVHLGRVESVRAKIGLARLSRREREVLDGVAHGGSNKEIARTLNISPRTVEIHRMTMMGKIGAKSAADAIRLHLSACIMNGVAAG